MECQPALQQSLSRSEPDDTALAAFEPHDRALAGRVAATDAAIDLHSLSDIMYGGPFPGGTLRKRWPVSGLVDAHLVEVRTRSAYLRGFAAVMGPNGMPLQGATKGFVEVDVR